MTTIQIFVACLMAILVILSCIAWSGLSRIPPTKLPYAIWYRTSSGWHEYILKK